MLPKGINEKKTDPELIEGITEANFISYKLFLWKILFSRFILLPSAQEQRQQKTNYSGLIILPNTPCQLSL